MSCRYSRCESRCSRSYSSSSDSSEERDDGRHKRFDKFSNEREKYDTFISSRKRQYSSTSSDYSSSVEPLSKRIKTDYQSPHSVNTSGVKLRLETDSPCQISLKVNSASSSQSNVSKVLPSPDHKPKKQRRNHRKRQLRKKGEYNEDRQDTLIHQLDLDTVHSRGNERFKICDDLPKHESRYSLEYSRDNMSDQLSKHESRYSRECSRDNMSDQLSKHESSYSREYSRALPNHQPYLPKHMSKYSSQCSRDNTTGHLLRNESGYSRDFSDHIPTNKSSYSRVYSRDWSDHLFKHKSGYNQVSFVQDNQEKTKSKKSEGKRPDNSREKKRDTKYEDDMYSRYDYSRENNRVNVCANRSSSESDRSEHDQCYRRKDYK